ncbi:hypothetical protein GCM10027176_10950 [Actinoallomurus bryophytorum]
MFGSVHLPGRKAGHRGARTQPEIAGDRGGARVGDGFPSRRPIPERTVGPESAPRLIDTAVSGRLARDRTRPIHTAVRSRICPMLLRMDLCKRRTTALERLLFGAKCERPRAHQAIKLGIPRGNGMVVTRRLAISMR